jgi:hypothetical protein
MTAAHNTVVVDGKNQRNLAGQMTERAGYEGQPAGKTTLWADGRTVRAVRAEAATVYNIERYERTIAMADVSDEAFYVFDLFRVRGGTDHARMTYSSFGSLATDGLAPQSASDYGHETQLRHFRTDASPRPGWSVDWKIEDRYHLLPPGEEVHLRLTDLTEAAEASLAEGWICADGFTGAEGEWIPCLMTRRRTDRSSLSSEFVGVLQPYRSRPFLASVQRLPSPAGSVVAEIGLADGRRDLWIATDSTKTLQPVAVEGDIRFTGDLAFVRRGTDGSRGTDGMLQELAIYGGQSLTVGGWEFTFGPAAGFIELHLENGDVFLRSGSRDAVSRIQRNGRSIRLRTQR